MLGESSYTARIHNSFVSSDQMHAVKGLNTGAFMESREFRRMQEEQLIHTQEEQEEHPNFQGVMMRWMAKSAWFFGCHVSSPEPSSRQIVEHEWTGHALYRSWCRHCVTSKGRAHDHASREEGELPGIGIHFGFFGWDREDVLSVLHVDCRNSSARMRGSDSC